MQLVTLFLTITLALALVVSQTYGFCCPPVSIAIQCCGLRPCNIFCCNCDGQDCDRHCQLRKQIDVNQRSARNVHQDWYSKNAEPILEVGAPLPIFNSIDENQDHLIDFKEAVYYYTNMSRRSQRSGHETVTNDFRLVFDQMDLDKDGFIAGREFDSSLP